MLLAKLPKPSAVLLLLAMSPALFAAETLRVYAMNYPAWVVRNYQTLPLAAGFDLRADDLLRTGAGGRLLLQLPDGGAIKLGESARLLLERVDDDAAGGRFGGRFHLLRGALRHTPSVWPGASASAGIEIRVGQILAAVDGADIWGRSGTGEDLVALLDGEISIEVAGQPAQGVDRPGAYVAAEGGRLVSSPTRLDSGRLREWTALTELAAGSGIAAHDGEWHLVLISLTRPDEAEKALRRFHERGFPAWRKSVIRDGRTLHRILLPGFVSIEAALAARDAVAAALGIDDAWVWKAPR